MVKEKNYTRLLTVRIEEELLMVFQLKCEQEGRTVSEAIREFIKKSIESNTNRD